MKSRQPASSTRRPDREGPLSSRHKPAPEELDSDVLEIMTLQVMGWLRRRRRLCIAQLVKGSTVKDQCARDAFHKSNHRCLFATLDGLSKALGLPLEKVIALARRWTRWRKGRFSRGHPLSVRIRKEPRRD